MHIDDINYWPPLSEGSVPTWTTDLEWIVLMAHGRGAIYFIGLKADV